MMAEDYAVALPKAPGGPGSRQLMAELGMAADPAGVLWVPVPGSPAECRAALRSLVEAHRQAGGATAEWADRFVRVMQAHGLWAAEDEL